MPSHTAFSRGAERYQRERAQWVACARGDRGGYSVFWRMRRRAANVERGCLVAAHDKAKRGGCKKERQSNKWDVRSKMRNAKQATEEGAKEKKRSLSQQPAHPTLTQSWRRGPLWRMIPKGMIGGPAGVVVHCDSVAGSCFLHRFISRRGQAVRAQALGP